MLVRGGSAQIQVMVSRRWTQSAGDWMPWCSPEVALRLMQCGGQSEHAAVEGLRRLGDSSIY